MVSRKERPGKIVIYSTSDEQARKIVNAVKEKDITSSNLTELSESSGNAKLHPSAGCDAFDIGVKSEGFTLRSPDRNGINRAVGPHGTPYEEALRAEYRTGGEVTVYKKVTPIKKSDDETESDRFVLFDAFSPSKKVKTQQEYPDLFNKTQEFEFLVTAESIKKRERECTQQKAVGNSAKNILELLGATIEKKKGKGSHYHLGHRRGHCLGGRESIENLDPCTAGANYSLLAYIEDPIHKLIASDHVESAAVKGEVRVHSTTGIAESICYTVTFFPNRTQCTKQINLFDYRIPTLYENEVAKAMLSYDPSNKSDSSGVLVNDDGVLDENTPEAANRPPMERRLF